MRKRRAGAIPVRMIRWSPLVLLLLPASVAAEERRYLLSGFERIRVEGPFAVTVTPGPAGARAEGEGGAVDRVEVRVEGTTLRVAASLNAWGGDPTARRPLPRVTVTVPRLRSAAVTGGGRLTIDRMAGQRIDLSVSGSGTLSVAAAEADQLNATLVGNGALAVAGSARQARFQSNGAGTIDAERLITADLTVTTQGAGDARFAATRSATVSASGQGGVRIAGAAACTVRGTAPVQCGEGLPPAR